MKRFKKVASFNDFNDPELKKGLEAASLFAASLNFTRPYMLTIGGPTGTGKTHLAKALLKQFMEQNRFEVHLDHVEFRICGNTVTWLDWRRFCSRARSQGGISDEYMDDLRKEWFLIIDDLGAGRDQTGFMTDVAEQLVAARSNRPCWTLITTNLRLEEIASSMDIRLADRLLRNGGQFVEINTISHAER